MVLLALDCNTVSVVIVSVVLLDCTTVDIVLESLSLLFQRDDGSFWFPAFHMTLMHKKSVNASVNLFFVKGN